MADYSRCFGAEKHFCPFEQIIRALVCISLQSQLQTLLCADESLKCCSAGDRQPRTADFDEALMLELAQGSRDRFTSGADTLCYLFMSQRQRDGYTVSIAS